MKRKNLLKLGFLGFSGLVILMTLLSSCTKEDKKDPPKAGFTSDKTSITVGESVQFTDQSTGEVEIRWWQFAGGDPSSSDLQNPLVTFNDVGSYTIILNISNSGGNDSEVKENYIVVSYPVIAPVCDFGSDFTTIYEGGSVNFYDFSTNSPDSWNWTFDGGTPSTSNAEHPANIIYNNAGSYSVTLTVSNSAGSNTSTKAGYISVLPAPPQPDFSADLTSIVTGDTILFIDQSTGNPTTWEWSFVGGYPGSSNVQNPGYILYSQKGVFDVSLTVSNQNGTNTLNKAAYITVEWSPIIYNNGISYGTFTDSRDGKIYKTVTIGSQTWLAENLGYEVGNSSYYAGSSDNQIFGRLYDWTTAVYSASPIGWHLPDENEWITMIDNLGGLDIAGGKLKEMGFYHWGFPNNGATNEAGFSALPGGFMDLNGFYSDLGQLGLFWTSTPAGSPSNFAYYFAVNNTDPQIIKQGRNKDSRLSIRLIQD